MPPLVFSPSGEVFDARDIHSLPPGVYLSEDITRHSGDMGEAWWAGASITGSRQDRVRISWRKRGVSVAMVGCYAAKDLKGATEQMQIAREVSHGETDSPFGAIMMRLPRQQSYAHEEAGYIKVRDDYPIAKARLAGYMTSAGSRAAISAGAGVLEAEGVISSRFSWVGDGPVVCYDQRSAYSRAFEALAPSEWRKIVGYRGGDPVLGDDCEILSCHDPKMMSAAMRVIDESHFAGSSKGVGRVLYGIMHGSTSRTSWRRLKAGERASGWQMPGWAPYHARRVRRVHKGGYARPVIADAIVRAVSEESGRIAYACGDSYLGTHTDSVCTAREVPPPVLESTWAEWSVKWRAASALWIAPGCVVHSRGYSWAGVRAGSRMARVLSNTVDALAMYE